MNDKDHTDLELYLEELISIASSIRYSYDWFCESEYMKLCNKTLSELLIIDVENAGL